MKYLSSKASLGRVLIEGDCIVLGPSVIGNDTVISNYVVIGYPIRSKILRLREEGGISLNKLDEVSDGARIGERCIIRGGTTIYERVVLSDGVETGHNVLIRELTEVGANTKIGSHSVIDGRVRIGNEVSIQTGVYLPPLTVIEDRVFLGPFVRVTNDKYPPSRKLAGVVIREEAVIGAGAILIAGVEVGERAVVAAGAIVTKNVKPNTVVAGVPARVIGTREEYERKRQEWEKG